MPNATLVWFRRDLRNHDHAALAEATRRSGRVHCAFVFDREILDALPSRRDRRVEFIRESLVELDAALRSTGGGMIVRVGRAVDEIPRLAQELGVSAVFTNRDYEPQARRRDAAVADALARGGIGFETFKDQAVLEFPEVATANGRPHTVFTPYRNAWRKRLTEDDLAPYRVDPAKLAAAPRPGGIPTLAQLGFAAAGLRAAPCQFASDQAGIDRQVQRLLHQRGVGGAVHRAQAGDGVVIAGVGDDDGQFTQLGELGKGHGAFLLARRRALSG